MTKGYLNLMVKDDLFLKGHMDNSYASRRK